jgi:ribosomal protein S18 acetylase RimI-like enzyme
MSDAPEIVRLEKQHRARAVESLARAFHNDPMWTCILPDDETRPQLLRPMWEALIRFAAIYGDTYTTTGGEGASCWVAPENGKMTVWKMIRTGFGLPRSMMRMPKEARERFFGMMRFLDAQHKRLMTGPHWYLWVLGVDPEAQGRGIGGALIRPTLERAEANGAACYLETQTESNVAFYRKRGFDILLEAREPVGDLPIWFMARPPDRG